MVLLCFLLAAIALGLMSRRYASVLPPIVSDNAGDALWSIAAFLGIAIFFPNWHSWQLGIAALLLSFIVEFSQLIDFAWLNSLRKNRIGQLFLGSGFLWLDLLRYSLGTALATSMDAMVLRIFSGKVKDQ